MAIGKDVQTLVTNGTDSGTNKATNAHFGTDMMEERDLEWRDYYVNYMRLKGWITEAEESHAMEAAQQFFDELTTSFDRVEQFYCNKEDTFFADAETLMDESPNDTKEQRFRRADVLVDNLERLKKYVEVNAEALRQIAQRFDKILGPAHASKKTESCEDKGLGSSWGMAKEALLPRIEKRLGRYKFGTSSARLVDMVTKIDKWKESGGNQSFTAPLVTPSMLKLSRRFTKLDNILVEQHKQTRVEILMQKIENWTVSANDNKFSIAYFLVGSVAIFYLWYAYGGETPITTTMAPATTQAPSSVVILDQSSFIVIWVTFITLTLLVWQWPSDGVMLGATLVLKILGLIDTQEAWGAFANEVVLSVATLSVVGDAVSHTGFVDLLFAKLIGDTRNLKMALIRTWIPCAIGAASISNTAVMACSMPAIERWCAKTGNHIALFFMPISYLMLIAGTFAIFSTSTNMVAQALLVSHNMPPFGQFDIAVPALVCSIACFAYLLAMTPVILSRFCQSKGSKDKEGLEDPESLQRSESKAAIGNSGQESFYARLRVSWRAGEEKAIRDSGLLGKEALLGGIKCILAVERHGARQDGVNADFTLQFDDIVVLRICSINVDALRRMSGFQLLPLDSTELQGTINLKTRELVEATLDESSPLVGQVVSEAKTFTSYAGTIVALRLRKKTGLSLQCPAPDMQFQHGDQLVLDVPAGFSKRQQGAPDFLMLRKVKTGTGDVDIDKVKAFTSGAILLVMLVFVAFSILPLFVCALSAVFLLALTGCSTMDELKKGVRLSVVLTIVGAFGLGNAIGKHGVASFVAGLLVAAFEPLGQTGLLVAVSVATVGLGVIFHGTACVALMFPLCTHVAAVANIDLHQMIAVLCIAVACQMLSPVSYNTNLMAYAACPEYDFTDFPKLGGPLVVLMLSIGIPMCQWWFPEGTTPAF